MAWATVGPFLGLDNVFVALALAPLCHRAGRFWLLTAWFACAEAAAPLVGARSRGVLPTADAAGVLQSALLATLGLTILSTVLFAHIPAVRSGMTWDPAHLVGSGKAIAALALLLAIDNLIAGAAFSPLSAIVCGLASAFPVLLACLMGRLFGSCLPAAARATTSGVLLLTAALIGFG